jgi:hypothetical protein
MPSPPHRLHDVSGNPVAVASFTGQASKLRFASDATLEHVETSLLDHALES